MMTIIPVIDVVAGQVVHARAGLRADYQPLAASFAGSSDPEAVIAALRLLYRFDAVYVADLDALEGRGDNCMTLQRLITAFPEYEFWLDAGASTLAIAGNPGLKRVRPVIGSENHDCAQLTAARRSRPDSLLSLDFRNDTLMGDPDLLENTDSWPCDVIIMTLDQVGMNLGPDIQRIRSIVELAPAHNYYAAGGIRDDRDLMLLEKIPVVGALVATALHKRTIQGFRSQ